MGDVLDEDGQVRRDGPDDDVGLVGLVVFFPGWLMCHGNGYRFLERATTWAVFDRENVAVEMKQQPTATRCQR